MQLNRGLDQALMLFTVRHPVFFQRFHWHKLISYTVSDRA
jgi:hypothetical protein